MRIDRARQMIQEREHARILILDDPDEWREFAVSILTEAGYQVVTSDKSLEYSNIRKFRQYLQNFALIIIDPIQEESNAIDILFHISQANQSDSTIALPSIRTMDLVKETMRLGIRNISPKPYQKKELLQIVEDAIEEIRTCPKPRP
jgi:DNA-binding NtrC family response regulator